MLCFLLALLLTSMFSFASSRGVNWYTSSSNIKGNSAFLAAHNDSISGAYLCCNFVSFQSNGSFTQRWSPADAAQQIALFTAASVETWIVGGVAEAAIHSGSWAAGLKEAARVSQGLLKQGVMGIIVDYEPADNYTQAHAAAYGTFLDALSTAIAPLRVGMDIAGWGILGSNYWPQYDKRGISRFTSMTPTYDATNVTEDEVFVAQAQQFFPPGAYAAGVGTVLAAGHVCGGGDFKWSNETFPPFVAYLGAQSVEFIDVWRCDIDAPYDVGGAPDLTAPFIFDALSAFLRPPQTA